MELIKYLEALASDCDNTDGWQEAAPTCRNAAETITELTRQLDVARGALEHVVTEAERENGNWVHLKRTIGVHAKSALKELSANTPTTAQSGGGA